MTDAPSSEPPEKLETIVQGGDSVRLRRFLDALPPGEVARTMYQMDRDERTGVMTLLEPDAAAQLVEGLEGAQAADLLRDMSAPQAAAIVDEMHSDEQADLLRRLGPEQSSAILRAMDPVEAQQAVRLIGHDDDTAGGIMITELLAFDENQTIAQVLDDLRSNAERYAGYDVQYGYVRDASRRLVGVLRMRDLLLSPTRTMISSIMIRRPLCVEVNTSLPDLRHFFDRHAFFGVPVIDKEGRLVGVVRAADVEEAISDQASRMLLRFAGILGGDELRNLPLRLRCLRRLSWLSINIVLNVIAASVIAQHESTLSAVISLAVFLPIISDMSGCSGNQAVAVSMRELSIGLIKPLDILGVISKELQVGVLNGIALGLLLALVAFAWKGNVYLGLVVGAALALNTVVAVILGGAIPLLLRAMKVDPALASGPLLTTFTDMCGFFLVLSFAAMSLERLT